MKRLRIADCGLRNEAAALFIVVLAFGLLAAPVPSDAQQPGKVYRIGWLGSVSGGGETDAHGCPIQGLDIWQAGLEGLRERGYIRGQNLRIECRWTEGWTERAFGLAQELVKLQPDLIVAVGNTSAFAAKRNAPTIPIVMVGAFEPVRALLVRTLARPGGNVTGLALTAGTEVLGKQLELLKEAAPKASRVAFLSYGGPPGGGVRDELEAAAKTLGLTLQFRDIGAPEELTRAFATLTTEGADALLGDISSFFVAYRHRIAELAAQYRLPGMFSYRNLVEAGVLMSYGPNQPALYRRLGGYVDKIFKGANPGDLPVEQPTKFDLVINLKTAKALGLTIPPALLMRADEVIE